jgi:D-alanine-D-alanine ligase
MMQLPIVPDLIMRPPRRPISPRILFLAGRAPSAPDYGVRTYAGDGGYPAYYHRIWSVLGELGYRVETSSECASLYQLAGRVDLVFSLMNRMPIDTPEVFVAATCAFLGLPCLGAAANVRALAEDKWFSKLAASAAGLPVPRGAIYDTPDSLSSPPPFAGPYFVKNRFGAASEGVSSRSIQDDWAGARPVAAALMERGMRVLVDEYVPGVDVTLPALGGTSPIPLGLVAPRSDKQGGIITEDLKRDDPLGYETFDPGPASTGFLADVSALWGVARPIDYFRMDYRFDPATGRRAFLEFNICCHIGRSGAICLAAQRWNLSQADILGHVVEFSLSRQARLRRHEPWAT